VEILTCFEMGLQAPLGSRFAPGALTLGATMLLTGRDGTDRTYELERYSIADDGLSARLWYRLAKEGPQ
jgi:hypothetical protein